MAPGRFWRANFDLTGPPGSEPRWRQDVHVSVPQLVRPRAGTSGLRGRDLHLGWSRLSRRVVG